jgi:hypothetical protein
MKKMLFALLTLLPVDIRAQSLQVVASAGQHVSGDHYVITATVGEPCVQVAVGDKYQATEGFQQGIHKDEKPAEEALGRDIGSPALQAVLFPNPASDRIQVTLRIGDSTPVRLQVLNHLGVVVKEAEATAPQHEFDLASLPAGHYWLLLQPAGRLPVLSLPFEKTSL